MTYHDGQGHVLGLMEDPANPPSHRTVMWAAYNADCARCWHSRHSEPVQTCLSCFPPSELAA